MINQTDIEHLKQLIRIEEVVKNEGITLSKNGTQLKGLCPFHDDHHPSMIVNRDRNQFYCPVCKEHGDTITFIKKLKGLNYIQALKYIAPLYNVELHEEQTSEVNRDFRREEWFRSMRTSLLNLSVKKLMEKDNEAYSYLKSRGFTDQTLTNFQIGFLPSSSEWGNENEHLTQFHEEKNLENRIIFPWFTNTGQLLALAGRVLNPETKGVEKKYWNSSFPKGNYFYGWNFAVASMRKTETVYIVEGYTDVMAMHQSGVTNTIALCGTALTDKHAYLLASTVKKVILCLDNDSAGTMAMDNAAYTLLPKNLQVEMLLCTEGNDPADMLHNYGEEYVNEWSQSETTNILDICIGRIQSTDILNTFILNARIRQLIEFLSLISDDILRGLYLAKVNSLIPTLSLEMLMNEVDRTIKNNL